MSISKTFSISGMTCSGCVSKVAARLEEHPEIISAKVLLQPPEAYIVTHNPLSDDTLEKWLQPLKKYHVSQDQHSKSIPKQLQTYRPLLILTIYLLLGAFSGAWGNDHLEWKTVMRLFMGGFFISFSFFKMLDLKGFANAYQSYDLVAKTFPPYGYVYPFIECALGLAYLSNFQPFWINLITAFVMAVSLAGVLRAVASKRTIQCVCLGTGFNLPMSTVTIVEDLLMLAMAILAL